MRDTLQGSLDVLIETIAATESQLLQINSDIEVGNGPSRVADAPFDLE